ncbi:uncharacterized protein C11orf96 homolog [Spea bombifrons]|uniref:uncharacterized protein C11orf96 homolog n=1 Tax=Spea bombifrons TaxID=233779 RepID=UPI002349CDC6|nr:uncharacterized protein C11orf96 homolog [Spea bombifrons]
MSGNQGEDHLCSYEEAMSQGAFFYEGMSQPSATSGPQKRTRLNRLRIQPLSFEEIREVEEEGVSPSEEEKARKNYLRSLESLRRGSHHLHSRRDRLNSYRLSLDSSDSDTSL